jgi:hypothetical protein
MSLHQYLLWLWDQPGGSLTEWQLLSVVLFIFWIFK